jgi:hypothetical protein
MAESLFTMLMNKKPGNFPEQVCCPFLDAAMVGLIPIESSQKRDSQQEGREARAYKLTSEARAREKWERMRERE